MNIEIKTIGEVHIREDKYFIRLHKEFRSGLKHIEGFSHLLVIWWAHLTDYPEARNRLLAKNLFRHAPSEVGVFASRTPERPNPIMISTIKVVNVDINAGTITTPFIDAENETQVLDIKPYFPLERTRECKTPYYYNHWPQWAEDSISFDWKKEIDLDIL